MVPACCMDGWLLESSLHMELFLLGRIVSACFDWPIFILMNRGGSRVLCSIVGVTCFLYSNSPATRCSVKIQGGCTSSGDLECSNNVNLDGRVSSAFCYHVFVAEKKSPSKFFWRPICHRDVNVDPRFDA